MSHFTEGVLQAYLDNEAAADARAQVDAHVAGCSACATRLQELRALNDTFAAAVGVIDTKVLTSGALAEVRARAAQQGWRERFASSRRTLRRAAILVLGLTAAAVATVPDRVPRLADQDLERAHGTQEPAPPPAVVAPAVPEAPPTGQRIEAFDGRIRSFCAPRQRRHASMSS
jgi:anti-sigma factor RsiW